MPEPKIALQPRAPQVEIAMAQPILFSRGGFFVDRKRRSFGGGQQVNEFGLYFNFSGGYLGVHGVLGSFHHFSRYRQYILGSEKL